MAERSESATARAHASEGKLRRTRIPVARESSDAVLEAIARSFSKLLLEQAAEFSAHQSIQINKPNALFNKKGLLAGNNLMATYQSKFGKSIMQQGSYPVGEMALSNHDAIAAHYDLDHVPLGCNYDLLDAHRSDVASLARFSQRVDHATYYLIVAIDDVVDHGVDAYVDRLATKAGVSSRRSSNNWYAKLASLCFSRWETTRDMLVLDVPLLDDSEQLYRAAFWSLCELTPADSQLKLLFERDRRRAARELVRHVDACATALRLTADLAGTMSEDVEIEKVRVDGLDHNERLAVIQNSLVEKAGDQLSLTEAAHLLGISRQAMHKKITSGAALGLMKGEVFVIPRVQFIRHEGKTSVVNGLREVLKLFDDAGPWSALQYLVEPDPGLDGEVPIELLRVGNADTVIDAARGYLGLDEG